MYCFQNEYIKKVHSSKLPSSREMRNTVISWLNALDKCVFLSNWEGQHWQRKKECFPSFLPHRTSPKLVRNEMGCVRGSSFSPSLITSLLIQTCDRMAFLSKCRSEAVANCRYGFFFFFKHHFLDTSLKLGSTDMIQPKVYRHWLILVSRK